MATGDRDRIDQLGAQLIGNLPQVGLGEAPQIGRHLDLVEQRRAIRDVEGLIVQNLCSSPAAAHDDRFADKPGHLSQKFRPLPKQIKMRNGLVDQEPGLGARTLNSQDRDKGRLAGRGVGADRLAGLRLRTFNVKQVVGDLKGEPEIVRIPSSRRRCSPDAFARTPPSLAKANAISAPVFMRCRRVISPMSSGCCSAIKVDHLPPDHAGATCRGRQRRDPAPQRTAGSPWMSGWASTSKSHRQQSVAGEHRGGVVRLLASADRPPAPPPGRCCPSPAGRRVSASRREPSRSPPRHARRWCCATPNLTRGTGQHQKQPQPLARRQRRMAHRLVYPRLEAPTARRAAARSTASVRRTVIAVASSERRVISPRAPQCDHRLSRAWPAAAEISSLRADNDAIDALLRLPLSFCSQYRWVRLPVHQLCMASSSFTCPASSRRTNLLKLSQRVLETHRRNIGGHDRIAHPRLLNTMRRRMQRAFQCVTREYGASSCANTACLPHRDPADINTRTRAAALAPSAARSWPPSKVETNAALGMVLLPRAATAQLFQV